jgi:hypothetical protein
MQNAAFRSAVVIALLLGGVLFVYAPQWLAPAGGRAVDEAAFTYVADLDYWQRTERETSVRATLPLDLAHDLNRVPLQIGDWQGGDAPETNLEVFILLEPEQFVQRLYRDSAGHYLWLSLVGGRNSRSFHPPDLCYDADGWQTSLSSRAIPLDEGGELYGFRLEARKVLPGETSATEHEAFYFYLFPNAGRDQANGIVLFKLTSLRSGSVEETLALQDDFVRHLFRRASPL